MSAAKNLIRYKNLIFAQCVPGMKENASKFKVHSLEFDQRIHMYFPKIDFIYAFDANKICKTGDYVLIEELNKPLTRLITHQIVKIVYKYGDMVDPITGRKCVFDRYREQDKELLDLYGKSANAFDYDRAPERGWQENRRDFSDKETYRQYNATDDSPYAV